MTVFSYVDGVVSAMLGKECITKGTNVVTEYLNNVKNAIVGKNGIENFEDSTNGAIQSGALPMGAFMFSVLFGIVVVVLYAYGAAKLSYCYSIQQGMPNGTAFMWSILAFFFCGWYYPFYGLYLNPICNSAAVRNKMQSGGYKKGF
jgi:hypothetical protein